MVVITKDEESRRYKPLRQLYIKSENITDGQVIRN